MAGCPRRRGGAEGRGAGDPQGARRRGEAGGVRGNRPPAWLSISRAGHLRRGPSRRRRDDPAWRRGAGDARPTDAHEAPLVGRDASLASLDAAFALAARGRRQVVFVSGEAGIGKTSITEAFLAGAERDHGAWVARGQSVEHSTAQEPYLAVLDAFGRLLKQSGRSQVEAVLRRYAPTWVAQLPVLSSDGQSLQRETLGATPERMLREIAEALETLTADVDVDSLSRRPALGGRSHRRLREPRGAPLGAEPAAARRHLPSGRSRARPAGAENRQAGSAGPRPVSGHRARSAHPRRCRGVSRRAIRRTRVSRRLRPVPARPDRRQSAVPDQSARAPRARKDSRRGRRALDARAQPRTHRRRRARFAPPVDRRDGRPPRRERAARARSGQRQRRRIHRRCRRGGARGRVRRRPKSGSIPWCRVSSLSAAAAPADCRMAPCRAATHSRTRSFSTCSISGCPRWRGCVCI